MVIGCRLMFGLYVYTPPFFILLLLLLILRLERLLTYILAWERVDGNKVSERDGSEMNRIRVKRLRINSYTAHMTLSSLLSTFPLKPSA